MHDDAISRFITAATRASAATCLVALGCAGPTATTTTQGSSAQAQATPTATTTARLVPEAAEIAALRAEGPAGLERLLDRWDTLSSTSARAALEPAVDAVAGQRYATVSRLYWYTELDAAEAAAHAAGKPILSLRMLGRLDRDLSCANSRLFRSVLYANAEVSAFLRDNFVLHWSSERPVPVVSIDFGDGRRVETTIAGNSAHYVLDADGRPIDVLPGLYGPKAFRDELAAVLPLARDADRMNDTVRARKLVEYHRNRRGVVLVKWGSLPQPPKANGVAMLDLVGASLNVAEDQTIGKRSMEMPMVRAFQLGDQAAQLPDNAALFTRLGAAHLDEAALDDSSRALIARLAPIDWAADPSALDDAGLDDLVRQLEGHVAADTALNELKHHYLIHGWFADGATDTTGDFTALNERIYRELFLTPASDAWLGMATPGVFTGLPGDGVAQAP